MRTIITCIALVLILTSCSKYQFVTINSDLTKEEKGMVAFENDTIAVVYRFSGPEGPVRIQVFNKLSVPLYFRWNSSMLVKQYWPTSPSRPAFTAASESTTMQILADFPVDVEYTRTDNPSQAIRIGSNSMANSKPLSLRKTFFHISTPDMKNGELNGDIIRSQYFNRQNTPLLFISELEFSTANDFKGSIKSQHEFWVDEVFITMNRPETVHRYKGREDMFFLRKGSGLGVFLATIGFFTYLAASLATE
jgi:hypothetical protein